MVNTHIHMCVVRIFIWTNRVCCEYSLHQAKASTESLLLFQTLLNTVEWHENMRVNRMLFFHRPISNGFHYCVPMNVFVFRLNEHLAYLWKHSNKCMYIV